LARIEHLDVELHFLAIWMLLFDVGLGWVTSDYVRRGLGWVCKVMGWDRWVTWVT